MATLFKCPKCGSEIEASEAITHQIEEQIAESLRLEHQKQIQAAVKKAEEETSDKLEKKLLYDIKIAKKEAEEEKVRNNKLLLQF